MSRLTAFSDSGRFSVIQAILSLTSSKTFWSSILALQIVRAQHTVPLSLLSETYFLFHTHAPAEFALYSLLDRYWICTVRACSRSRAALNEPFVGRSDRPGRSWGKCFEKLMIVIPTAFPLDTIGRHYKLPSRYPDNHDDMCQTERQILHWIQILVLVRIDGVLSTPAFSNCVQHIVLKPFQLRMPFDDVPPAFIG